MLQKVVKLYKFLGNPNIPPGLYYARSAVYGFTIGFGLVTFMIKFEVQAQDRTISFMRTSTRLGIVDGNLAANNEVNTK